jgi:hypothetical protein
MEENNSKNITYNGLLRFRALRLLTELYIGKYTTVTDLLKYLCENNSECDKRTARAIWYEMIETYKRSEIWSIEIAEVITNYGSHKQKAKAIRFVPRIKTNEG